MDALDVEKLISQLSLEEKVSLTSGIDMWHTASVPRLGIPSIRLTDGPNGVRGTRLFNGVPAACLPCATALGATWDAELVGELGYLLGEEARAKKAHVLLGPTINIQRSPLGGRGFESFSEDGVLSGVLAGRYCQGVWKTGIIPTLKHFVCNDQEHQRKAVNVIVTQRALREIYLLPFQIALKQCPESAVMTAYNKINGEHVSESKYILDEILRKEWGFSGLIVSDWNGTYSTSRAIKAGLDLEMPGKTRFRGSALQHAVTSGKVPVKVLDARVRNVLNTVTAAITYPPDATTEEMLDRPKDRHLLRRACSSSIVLLKNDRNILPFRKDKPIAVIGPTSQATLYAGGGSSMLPAYRVVTPLEGISTAAREVKHARGVYSEKQLPLLGSVLRQPDNPEKVGYVFRVYNEPPEVTGRAPIDEQYLTSSNAVLFDYKNPKLHSLTFFAQVAGTFTPEESGVYDFGVAVCGIGKLFIDGELIVDNETVQRPGSSFFGTGTVEEIGSKHLKAGQVYQILFEFGSGPLLTFTRTGVVNFGAGGFRLGYRKRSDSSEAFAQAVALASSTEQTVVFVGLGDEYESEGYDRENMDLPPGVDELVSAVLEKNPNAAIVIQSGTPVSMPWESKASAILQAWYGGNELGHGIADILFGDTNPSAKLPITIPKRVEDSPVCLNFGSERGRVLYGEDVYVGYRYFDRTQVPVMFPFGHGLSYTSFTMSALRIDIFNYGEDQEYQLKLRVANVGLVLGSEVIQVYVIPPKPSPGVPRDTVKRPIKELKAFSKVANLKPGEKREVSIALGQRLATSWWDEANDAWCSEAGDYSLLLVGTGKENTLTGSFKIEHTTFWNGL